MSKSLAAILLLLGAAALMGESASADTALTGEISADVALFGFNNKVDGDSRDIDVRRSLSTQHLELQLAGPIAEGNFAEYVLKTRLAGAYFRVQSSDELATEYINPELTSLLGSMTLFPGRPYPLHLYASSSLGYNIRYEANNRSDLELQEPQLAVVRRYDSENDSWGGQWRWGISEPLNFGAEYKKEDTQILRSYDFEEDLDIFANFNTSRVDPTSPTHQVDIINNINDDTVEIRVGRAFAGTLLDTLAPGASGTYTLDKGLWYVEFQPMNRRPYRTQVDVQGDMTWRIIFNEPSGPNDLRQSRGSGNTSLDYEKDQIKNNFYSEFTSSDESIQGIVTDLSTIQNQFGYDFSDNSSLGILTSYNGTNTDIVDVSSQVNKQFLHQTTGKWAQADGWATNAMHSYNWMSSESPANLLTTNTHMITAQAVKPSRRWNHRFSARGGATLLKDSGDFKSDQYQFDLGNQVEVRRWGFVWQPKNQSKYSLTKQKNPNSRTSEWEARNYIEGERTRLPYVGDLRLKTEYSWRRRNDEVGSDTKNRYVAEAGFTKRFGQKYRLAATLTQEKEAFSSTVNEVEGPTSEGAPEDKPDENRGSYRFDLMAAPWQSLNVGAGIMLIKQDNSSIQRRSISMIARIPRLEIPVRFFLVSESRSLESLPEQTRMEMETKLSYSFRAVRLTFEHSYITEKLIRENYSFQEIRGDITRSFSIF